MVSVGANFLVGVRVKSVDFQVLMCTYVKHRPTSMCMHMIDSSRLSKRRRQMEDFSCCPTCFLALLAYKFTTN